MILYRGNPIGLNDKQSEQSCPDCRKPTVFLDRIWAAWNRWTDEYYCETCHHDVLQTRTITYDVLHAGE